MKLLKYKLFALAVLTVSLSTIMLLPQTTNAEPIPTTDSKPLSKDMQKDCYKKYNAHGFGNGTDDKFKGDLQKAYNNSKCDASKGGNCSQNVSSGGVIVTCTNPADTGTSNGLSTTRDSGDCKADSYKDLNQENCEMIHLIAVVTKALSGIAGLVIIAMMIVAGIQYSSAGADPSKIQAAKQKIFNAILALLLLVFGFSILQWLVPGGIF